MGIHAYVPGKSSGADGKPLIKLSANENPSGSSPDAVAAMAAAAQAGGSRYPDPDATALRAALGAAHGIDPARIVCGTGSDELLNLAAQGFAGPGDAVIYVRYGFAVYDIAARRCGATPVVAPDADYGCDVDGLLACVTPATKVVFLANPNNPTGSFLPGGEVARLHAALPAHVLLVLDQAYAEYLDAADDDGGLAMAAAHSNVLVTRTFSKIYGLAGERIGWATGAPALLDVLNRIRGPFNVTATGQAAAIASLGDTAFVNHAQAENARMRQWLAAEIAALGNHGLRAVPSQGNFILVLFEGAISAEAAYEGLIARGFITRWLPGQGLSHGLRITIGDEAQTRALAAALRNMLEGQSLKGQGLEVQGQ